MVLGALVSVAVAIVLLVGAVIEGGGPPLAALSLAADVIAASCLYLALTQRRRLRTKHQHPGQLPAGPGTTGSQPGPTPGALPSGPFPPGAAPPA